MSKEIEAELAAMFGDADDVVDGNGTEPEVVTPPTEGEVAPVVTPVEGDVVAPVATPPVEEPEWKVAFNTLMEQNKKLQEQLTAVVAAPKVEDTPPVEDAQKEHDLVSAEEFDKVLAGDVGTLNTLLNRAVKKGFEQAMLAVPEAVQRRVETSIDSKTQIKAYFNENKDLIEHRAILGVVAKEVLEKNPHLNNSPLELLKAAGDDLRKRFNLVKPSEKKPDPVPAPAAKPPTDVNGRQGTSPTPKKQVQSNDIASQIAAQFED